MAIFSSAPEYLICMECESPCYDFEWKASKLVEILCATCGSEDLDSFITEEDLEAMSGPLPSGH